MAYFTSGQRLTSAVLNGLPQPLQGKILGQASATYLQTSGTTELKLPKLTLTGITVASGAALEFRLNARISGGSVPPVPNDVFEFRVRQANDTSGTIVSAFLWIIPSTDQCDMSWSRVTVPSVTVSNETFYLSVVRILGSGTLGVQGQSGTTQFAAYSSLTNAIWAVVP
jgi:hypothetical protein